MNRNYNTVGNALMKKKDVEPTFAADLLNFERRTLEVENAKVLALGDPQLCRMVEQDLKEMGIQVRTFKTVKSLKQSATGFEEAIIYCGPLVRSEILSVHKGLKNNSKMGGMEFFAIVPDWLSATKERTMYKNGIRMVFEWPRERMTFSKLFSEAMKHDTIRVISEDTDHSLKKAITNRMITHFEKINSSIEISVYNGIVIARGKVSSVGDKNMFSQFFKKIPGVRGVISNSIQVEEGVLPQFMKSKANQMLSDMEQIPESTLMVKVSPNQQELKIVGTAASINTVERAKKRMELFKGVKSVESEVTISPRRHAKDLALAKKAQRVVDKVTTGIPDAANVKVLRGEAFIKGKVTNSVEVFQIENAIRSLEGIKAVVNRLEVENNHPISMNH